MMNNDEQLLNEFFNKARQQELAQIPDNDPAFTKRIMDSIPSAQAVHYVATESQPKHSLWPIFLQLLLVMAVVVTLFGVGYDIILFIFNLQLDDLLVKTLLFLHRIPAFLSSLTIQNVVEAAVTLVVLMTLSMQLLSQKLRLN